MLARKSLLIYASNLVGALLGASSLYFVGRYIAPEAVGMVAVGLSIAGFALVFASMNFDSAHVKRVSEGQDLGDCIRTYGVVRATMTVAAASAMALAAWAWHEGRGFYDATTLPILLALSLYVLLNGLRGLPTDTFVGLQQVAKVQVLNLVDMLAKATLTILAALAIAHYATGGLAFSFMAGVLPQHAPLSLPGVALLFALVLPATAASSTFAAWALFVGRYPTGRFRWDLVRSYARFALPLAILAPLTVMSAEVDTLMLGFFWSADEAGYYYAAKRLILLVSILPAAVASIFFPMMSDLVARRDELAIRSLLATTLRNLSLVLGLLTMFLVTFAAAGVEVFLSAPYLPSAAILQWLALTNFLAAMFAVYYAVLQGHDRPWACTRASLVLVVGNVVLNAVLIPDSLFGVDLPGLKGAGAAMGTAIAQVVALGVLVAQQPASTRGSFPARSVGLHVLAAGLVGGLLSWSQPWPVLGNADRFYDLVAVGAVGTVLYVGVLAATREVTRRDWLLVKDLVNVTKMKDYVVGELKETAEKSSSERQAP